MTKDKDRKEYKPHGTERWPHGGLTDDYEPGPNDRDRPSNSKSS
jgi:hypothetical protein